MRTMLIFAMIGVLVASTAEARGRAGFHASKATPGGKHYVRTYVKKNGTVVVGHIARNPARP